MMEIIFIILSGVLLIGVTVLSVILFFSKKQNKKLIDSHEELFVEYKKVINFNEELLEQNQQLTATNSNFQTKNTELQELNFDLQTLNGEYVSFVRKIYEILSSDIGFLKGELAEKLSLDIPEVKSLYQGLVQLLEDISAVKNVIEESERIKDE